MLVGQDRARAIRFLSQCTTLGRAVAMVMIFGVLSLQVRLVMGVVVLPLGKSVQALAAAYLMASYSLVPGGIGFWILNLRLVRWFGVLSYSIYIWHYPFFEPYTRIGISYSVWLTFPVNVIASLVVAVVSYYALERPFLALRTRWRERNKIKSDVASQSAIQI